MRKAVFALSALALTMNVGCKAEKADTKVDEEVTASAAGDTRAEAKGSAAAEAKASLAVPYIGGVLAAIGDYKVELAIFKSGLVEARVLHPNGKALAKPEAAKVKVTLAAEGDAKPECELKWDPAKARLVGNADADAKLVADPVEVSLDVEGKSAKGKVEQYALISPPRFGGTKMAVGSYDTEVIARPDGHVQAFVTTPAGAELDGEAGADVRVNAGADANADAGTKLAWDPAHACFAGKLKGGADLKAEPLMVSVALGGKTEIGGRQNLALTADAEHGGEMLVAGDFVVELVVDGNAVTAYVFDASGKAHAGGDLDLKLELGADAKSDVALAWDAPSASYRGKLAGRLDLEAQPIRVAVNAGGRLHVGAAQSMKALARVKLGGDVNLGAEAEVDGDAKLGAKAKLAARAPKVDANVGAKAKADARAGAGANAGAKVNVPKPVVNVKVDKQAKASAGGDSKAGAKAGAKAGFSLGTK